MIRPALVLTLCLVATTSLFAQSTDLAITMSPSKTTVFSGERFDVTITAFNKGPGDAAFVNVTGSMLQPQQLLSMTPPPGWTCEDPGTDTVTCTAVRFPAGTQAVFHLSVHMLNTVEGFAFPLSAAISIHDSNDPVENNSATSNITVVRHPSTTALSIGAVPQQSTVAPGQTAMITIEPRNDGPDAATNVVVRASYSDVAAQMQGAGWTCSATACTRPMLAVGQSAPITFSFPATTETALQQRFTIGAELSFDPSGTDNFAITVVGVGDAATWRRILLPLSFAETPGAFGSRWKTEITAVIDSDTMIELEPDRFCTPWSPCPTIPLRRPFDLALALTEIQPSLPTQFLYVRAADEPKLALNLRVRDLARTAETWGTEVKIVRENEWRTTPITLAPLPVDPLFRLTLRVYDFDARAGNRVAVRIYADDETSPRATLIKTFATVAGPRDDRVSAGISGLPPVRSARGGGRCDGRRGDGVDPRRAAHARAAVLGLRERDEQPDRTRDDRDAAVSVRSPHARRSRPRPSIFASRRGASSRSFPRSPRRSSTSARARASSRSPTSASSRRGSRCRASAGRRTRASTRSARSRPTSCT